jgi:general secretion pathway protein D
VTVATGLNVLFAKGGSPPLRGNQPQAPQNQGPNQQQAGNASASNFELEKETKEDAYYPWLGGQPENLRSTDGRSTVRAISDLVGQVRVVPDRRSNSLLITSKGQFFAQVLKLVNEMDAPTPQVLIEAKIVEVSSDFRDKLGVRWSPDGTKTFDADDMDMSLMAGGSGSVRNVFLGTAMADSLRSGVLDSSINLDFLVQFLRKTTGSKILAEPQINVSDNEIGRLFVGARVPYLRNSQANPQGGLTQSFEYKDVGIILEVTPHINNSEDVALKIRAESSNVRAGETVLGGAIFDTRNFQTDLMVKSGETLVLGGIIQTEDVDTVRKVPILGSIPGLGWAFKKKDKVSREVELMVFLRPKVTRSPEEVKDLLNEVEGKTPKIQQWKNESHSPDQ